MNRDSVFRHYLLPTLLSLGLLLYLSLWVVYQFLTAYNQDLKRQRKTADAFVEILRDVVARETRDETIQGVAERILAEPLVEGLEIRRDRRVLVAKGIDDVWDEKNLRGRRGRMIRGTRLMSWASFHKSENRNSENRETLPECRVILVINTKDNLRGLGVEGRLLLISFLLGIGGVITLFLAWNYSLRYRDLQSRLKTAKDRREQMEEVGLAAAGLAHETKNPLGLIRGLAQQIANNPENPENARRMAEEIMEEADVTTARLGDFLTYAKVRKPALAPVDVVELFEKVRRLVAEDFAQNKVSLDLRCQHLTIMADQETLSQVILNLLMNSLNFTNEGDAVTMRLRKTGSGRASLSVKDTGQGIPPDLLPNIFKPYVTKRSDGFGMGLAIVKRIVEQSEWNVRVKSREGKGTEVIVEGVRVVEDKRPNRRLGDAETENDASEPTSP